MDNSLETKSTFPLYRHKVFFICLIFLAGVAAIIAVNLTKGYTEITELSCYNRYLNKSDSFTKAEMLRHFFDAVLNALPVLIQLFLLFVLSFSPFLIPAGVALSSLRGFIMGCALHCVRDISGVAQFGVYALCTFVICVMGSVYLKKDITASQKVFLLFILSGICVTAEFILSFIL